MQVDSEAFLNFQGSEKLHTDNNQVSWRDSGRELIV
jgi:hypothetical protein